MGREEEEVGKKIEVERKEGEVSEEVGKEEERRRGIQLQ